MSNPHLRSIVERLKRGEHVRGDDKSVYELTTKQARRVGNILKHLQQSVARDRARLAERYGGEGELRTKIVEVRDGKSTNPAIRNLITREKRFRHNAIDKLEEMP